MYLPYKNEIELKLGRQLSEEERLLLFKLELRDRQSDREFAEQIKWNLRVLGAAALLFIVVLALVLFFGGVIPMWLLFADRWGATTATAICASSFIFGFVFVFALILGIKRKSRN